MKNSIRKKHYKPKVPIKHNSIFLYNFSFIAKLSEILIGAVLGIALCVGFIVSFFVFKGSILFSLVLFFIILIVAIFFVLLFKYVFLSIILKINEIEILEKVCSKS